MNRALVLLLAGALAGCALTAPSSRTVYEQGRTVVQIEKDPAVSGSTRQDLNTHPAVIRPTQLIKVLSGVLISSTDGLYKAAVGSYTTAGQVFQEDELASLAPILSRGLDQADPSERVAFTFWSTVPDRRNGPISGYLAVKDPYLIFRLKEHPIVGWQDPENPPPASLFQLDFKQDKYLKPGSEDERKGSYKARPTVQVDYRKYLSALQDQPAQPAMAVKEPAVVAPSFSVPAEVRSPSVPPVVAPREPAKADLETVQELQRQVRELTEDLATLRRDLTETKQLLADKVLELNRLQKKIWRDR